MGGVPREVTELAERAFGLQERVGRRVLIGIVGAPGAGKSWLAERLASGLGERAVVVGMDGYHLAQIELQRLGRADRKGAPDTFDAAGLAALLHRLRGETTETVYAPRFDRALEEPIAGAIPILPQHDIVIVEGNYLHLPTWSMVGEQFDELWFLDVDPMLRRGRLQARHESFGRSPEAAHAWITNVDEPNAVRIQAARDRTHWQVTLTG